MKWGGDNFQGNLKQNYKIEGLQDGTETCYDVYSEDSGTNKKIGGRAGGRRVEELSVSEEKSCSSSLDKKVREARTGLDLYREEMVDILDKEC